MQTKGFQVPQSCKNKLNNRNEIRQPTNLVESSHLNSGSISEALTGMKSPDIEKITEVD